MRNGDFVSQLQLYVLRTALQGLGRGMSTRTVQKMRIGCSLTSTLQGMGKVGQLRLGKEWLEVRLTPDLQGPGKGRSTTVVQYRVLLHLYRTH